MTANVEIRLFGSPEIRVDGNIIEIQRRKALALLAYLIVTGETHQRDSLASLLWPESSQEDSRAALRTTLSTLNKTPLGNGLSTSRDEIGIAPDHGWWVDVYQFKSYTDSHSHPTQTATPAFRKAVNIYRGHFLAGFTLSSSLAFDEWQVYQSNQLRTQFTACLKQAIASYQREGNIVAAIDFAYRWLEIDSLEEHVHLLLMQLYIQNGQRTAAIRQYESCVELLKSELDIIPHNALTQFYENIKNEDIMTVSNPNANLMSNAPPFPTLMVGRDEDIATVKSMLTTRTLNSLHTVGIQGWPGVGKSTLAAVLAYDPDLLETFSDGLLWVSLGEKPNLMAKLDSLGRTMRLPDIELAKGIEDKVVLIRGGLRDRKVLLIVDDVWDIDHARLFAVGGSQGAILITTRFNDLVRQFVGKPSNIYRLPILDTTNGIELLAALAPDVLSDYQEAAEELVDALEGLPLALQVAGRLLQAEAQMGWGINDLLESLQEGSRLLAEQAPQNRIASDDEPPPTLRVLLRKSTDYLPEEGQLHFALLGVFAPKPATFDLNAMKAVWEVDDPKPSVRLLVDRGLLEPIGNGRFQMHALLVFHAKSLFGG